MDFENIKFENQNQKSEKEKILENIRHKIDEIKDKLGEPIDEGIKETVVMFNAFNLPTTQSCEGHLDKKGLPAPWVEIYPKEPEIENWQENEELRNEIIFENNKNKMLVENFLKEFYKNREVPKDIKLVLNNIGYGFRIQSAGLEKFQNLNKKQKLEKYKLTKKEMEDFTEFLKKKFFEK